MHSQCGMRAHRTRQIWRIMKLTTFFLLCIAMHISASSLAQRVTIQAKGAKLETVFNEIKAQTGYTFVYRDEWMAAARKVDVQFRNAPVKEVLDNCFKNQPFTYSITKTTVVIRKKDEQADLSAPAELPQQDVYFRGLVTDEKGEPIPGASVSLDGASKGTATRQDGTFDLRSQKDPAIIKISSLGYQAQTLEASSKKFLRIIMKTTDQSLSQVVVTGMVTRNKNSFSGATAVYSGQQLKTITNGNVVQALRTLDPSFLVMENNLAGSNPNVLPTIELRGQSAITNNALRDQFSGDPNQPLFMVDGFESSLRQVMDLDMNRVASITILKDAASTAMYGSRAANGVVVIETIKAAPGKILVNYVEDLSVDAPDLTSYNMMTAAEKLQYEVLAGRYQATGKWDYAKEQFSYYDSMYSRRLQDVTRGVNSYWLSDPVRTGVTQRHSLYAGGGTGALTFDAGGSYRNLQGVMKGSGRQEWSGRLNLSYRAGKVNISNVTLVNGARSQESPYGDFADWVNTNPYYEKKPMSEPYLDLTRGKDSTNTNNLLVKNPLYVVGLNNYNKSKSYNLATNLLINYDISNAFRLQGALQLAGSNSLGEVFVSPRDLSFVKTDIDKRGTYSNSLITGFSYNSYLMLTYYRLLGKHMINLNARTDISENRNRLSGYNLTGFPASSDGNPRFAFNYAEGSQPALSSNVARRNKLLATGSYSYDNRYSVDATVSYDGSTAFGSANQYSPFYALGARWNLAKEKFLNTTYINQLSLRGNFGVTGNQNFSSFSSLTTYQYGKTNYLDAFGLSMLTLGNADLKWQNSYTRGAGLDLAILNNRLKATVDIYTKVTNPLVIAVSLPSSTGLSNYPFNAGKLTVKGQEFRVSYEVISNRKDGIVWLLSATGSHYTSTYSELDKYLYTINDKLRQSNSLVRYKDGYAPDDIWAVRSLGIDPATGREIMLTKDGKQTFDYNYADVVKVGNSRPDIQGVLGSVLNIRNLQLQMSFRYIAGQDIMNTALFNKVENITYSIMSQNNLDKRALYERWKKPGDETQFKGISLLDKSYITSRFVQEENTFSLESASIGYTLRDMQWLKKLSLSNIGLTARTNELFRISTVKRERGIDYPFARTFSFTLSANFL